VPPKAATKRPQGQGVEGWSLFSYERVFSSTLAGANGVCTCMGMRDHHCCKALYRELKRNHRTYRRGLTRVRRHFVVYLRLHRGKFAQKHGKMASFSSEHEAPAELRPEPRSAISFSGQLYARLWAAWWRVFLRRAFHVKPYGC